MNKQPRKAEEPATATTKIGEYKEIPISELQSFRNHAFNLYQGDKLNRLADSIKERGIIHPVIVRQIQHSNTYEIVSGHNRVEASKSAGLDRVPAVIRKLSDDEAIILANEANIEQRNFDNWLHVEKSKSIHQYHEAIKRQGVRPDPTGKTFGEIHQKSDDNYARKKTSVTYNKSEHTIRLYLELYNLAEGLMERLDNKEFGTSSAQQLSHIEKDGQVLVNTILNENKDTCKITVNNSKAVRKELAGYSEAKLREEEKKMFRERIKEVLRIEVDHFESEEKFVTIKMDKIVFDRQFPGKKPDDAVDEIITAVDFYHDKGHEVNDRNNQVQL